MISTDRCLHIKTNDSTVRCYGFTVKDSEFNHSLVVRKDNSSNLYFPITDLGDNSSTDRLCPTGIITDYGKVCAPRLEITLTNVGFQKNVTFNYDFDLPVTVTLSANTDGRSARTGTGVNNISVSMNIECRYIRITDYNGKELFFNSDGSDLTNKTFIQNLAKRY